MISGHVAGELDYHFHHLLKFAGIFDRQPQAQENNSHNDQEDDEDFHCHIVGNGMGWIGRRFSNLHQQRRYHAAQ